MTEHDLRLIEIGEKAGAEKATKQIVEWLREQKEKGLHRMMQAETPTSQRNFAAGAEAVGRCADAIEAGEPFQ